jgi:hypothetical protein
MKQTVESPDQRQVLFLGDDRSSVQFGSFSELLHSDSMKSADLLGISFASHDVSTDDSGGGFGFTTRIASHSGRTQLQEFSYRRTGSRLDVVAEGSTYGLYLEVGPHGRELIDNDIWPVKCYGFRAGPPSGFVEGEESLAIVQQFESAFRSARYLGPLRDFPKSYYPWSGTPPQDVGKSGENTIQALLASRVSDDPEERKLEAHVAHWLKELGLIQSFRLEPVAKGADVYEARIRTSPGGAEVLLPNVGFGLSQVLPVLVLCFYAPKGSTIIFEQPEIHLHPAVQAGLADLFAEVVKTRDVQIIVESHSEHFVTRLQRRIAEETTDPATTALYFCRQEAGASEIERLNVDEYGNITNWPQEFFGNRAGDVFARADAEMRRLGIADE